ncbi:hypothetical protein [Bacillus pinisoli]|uniref:hypothetical protein n=1 Tax=Bacillus pinisoli TaxID=2901866 RepID=UPI001FF22FAC|nr:hypothetical protein [Bacillus pinisoli]
MTSLRTLGILFILICSGCSSERIEEVVVYKMKTSTIKEDHSIQEFTNELIIQEFIQAFRMANQEPGIVNMADPHYRVKIGEESYFLWIHEEQGTIMNWNDTNTIFTLSERSTLTIKKHLN